MSVSGETGGQQADVETREQRQERAMSYLTALSLERYADHQLKDFDGNPYEGKTAKDILEFCDEPIRDFIEGLKGEDSETQAHEINDQRDFILENFIVIPRAEGN